MVFNYLSSFSLKYIFTGLSLFTGLVLLSSCEVKEVKEINLSNDENLTKIPAYVYLLKDLEILDISNTSITTLSDSICDLTNLKVLRASGNKYIKNEIPKSIFCLKNLEVLDMSGSRIRYIDEYIYKLGELKKLYLANNQLTQLPGMLSLMPSISLLDLSNNQLDDEEDINSLQDCTQIKDKEDQEECRVDLSDSVYCESYQKLPFKRGSDFRQEYTKLTGLTFRGGKEDKCYNYWIFKYLDYSKEDQKYLLEYTINGKTIREWRVLQTSRLNAVEQETGLIEVPFLSHLYRIPHRDTQCYYRASNMGISKGFLGWIFPPDRTYSASTSEIYPERYRKRDQEFQKPIECIYPKWKGGSL